MLRRNELERAFPGVVCCALQVPVDLASLVALEQSGLAEPPEGAVARRRAEFLAGRKAAALALAELGVRDRFVGRNRDGSPAFPVGTVGSISHADGVAVAAVERASAFASIGIDLEAVVELERSRELGGLILDEAELELVTSALGDADEALSFSLVFSAKESFYKCLYPRARVFLEFSDVRAVGLERRADGHGEITLRLERDLAPPFTRGFALSVHFFADRARVATTALLSKGVS